MMQTLLKTVKNTARYSPKLTWLMVVKLWTGRR